jgi:hypothetical protein
MRHRGLARGLLVSTMATVYSPRDISGAPVRGRLDSIDWAILKELQADGSITNVELARRRVGMFLEVDGPGLGEAAS